MVRDVLGMWWVHTVTVETRTGQDVDGADVFGAPRSVVGWIDDATNIVRTAYSNEVTSSAQFYTPTTNAGLFTPDSRVTLPTRQAQVITVNVNDSGPLGLPDHAVISLT